MRLIYMAAHGRCNVGFTGCGVKSLNFYAAVKTGFFLPGDLYNRMLADLLQELEGLEPNNGSRPKLLLCGIVFDPLEIHRINGESGTLVVTTYANIWGRYSNYPVAPDAETYEAVAKSYLDVYINTGFEDQINDLASLIDEFSLAGFIMHSNRSCKPYSVGMYRMQENWR